MLLLLRIFTGAFLLSLQKIITTRVTAYVFYVGIFIWVLGIIVGGVFQLSYVSHRYRVVTPLIYAGGLLIALTICNLISGRVWRGHHRVASRIYEPVVYWSIVSTMGIAGVVLILIGYLNLTKLN